MSLDTEVTQHGVRLPAAQELDGIRVNAGTQQCSGPTRPQGPGGDQRRVNTGLVLDLKGGVAESVGDEARRHIIPVSIVRAHMVVERCLGGSVVLLQVVCKPPSGLARAVERIICSGMTHFLTPNAVLLVREFQSRVMDLEDGLVIQRCGRSRVDLAMDVEVEVTESEGLRPTVFQGVGVFGWAQQPEESQDDEVDDRFVGLAILGVVGVQGINKGEDDGSVDRVYPAGGTVFVPEALEESIE